jgi:uncharacterized protein YjbI with pentapeptide repeats
VDEQQQSRWQPTRRQLLWAGVAVGLLTIAILVGYRYGITLWDWLKLLVVPAVIAGGGIWFNRQQRERELEIARQQRERDVEIAERRTQDEALQAYLDQMSSMLIPNTDQPSLYRARPGDSLSSVARARTLTILPRLDEDRKARVVQFLYESGLIAEGRPVLDLQGADLRGANLSEADLSGANLRGAYLNRANLSEADLSSADLSRAYLSEAKLIGADLSSADLSEADLIDANLRGAYLRGANLRADLSGAYLFMADLSGAYLSGAYLNRAHLRGANLSRAYLRGAHLRGAYLSRADLDLADLSRADVTEEQLEEASTLEGATMPNGQKYEDWLKSRDSEGDE